MQRFPARHEDIARHHPLTMYMDIGREIFLREEVAMNLIRIVTQRLLRVELDGSRDHHDRTVPQTFSYQVPSFCQFEMLDDVRDQRDVELTQRRKDILRLTKMHLIVNVVVDWIVIAA